MIKKGKGAHWVERRLWNVSWDGAGMDTSTPLWPALEIRFWTGGWPQQIETSITKTRSQFWHVLTCLVPLHPHIKPEMVDCAFPAMRQCRRKRACLCAGISLFIPVKQSLRTSGLISPRPLGFICRPPVVRRPDWLWHRRSKANWINTITRILIVLKVFFCSSWKHTNTDRDKQTVFVSRPTLQENVGPAL